MQVIPRFQKVKVYTDYPKEPLLFDRGKTNFVITCRVDGEDGFQRDSRSKMLIRTDDGGESIVNMDALLITCLSQGPSKGEVS
jgi:hypothetical protein